MIPVIVHEKQVTDKEWAYELTFLKTDIETALTEAITNNTHIVLMVKPTEKLSE